ncbi:MAG: DUF1761 domain-containing protein [candidate division FCPU426 bacterium]
MLHLDVNWLEVAVMAIFGFLLGWLWYSPLMFAGPWMKAKNISPDSLSTEANKKKMPMLMLVSILGSFASAWAIQVVVHSIGAEGFQAGKMVGLVLWFGIMVTASLGSLWEGRPVMVLLISAGQHLVTYTVIAGVAAVWK